MKDLKEYWLAHRTFVIAAGGMLLFALVLLLCVAMPARSAGSDAFARAERLQKMVKAGEGSALSATARRQLEGEVEALQARVVDLQKVASPPKPPSGADKVLYGNKLAELGTQMNKAASEQNVIVENEAAFPKNPEEDLPLYLTKIEIAQKVLARAVAAGIRRVKSITAAKDGNDFLTAEMTESGAIRRTMVEFEFSGSMDAIARLMHSLQQRDSFQVVPRFKTWREKPDDPETSVRFAAGGIEVGDAKTEEKGNGDSGGFIFGR